MSRAATASVFLALSVSSGVAPGAPSLAERLYAIEMARTGEPEQMPALERRALDLLDEFTAPEEVGRICYAVGSMYAANGFQPPSHAQKAVEYCREATRYPLSAEDMCFACQYWGHGIMAQCDWTVAAQFREARRRAVVPYLMGLRVLAKAPPEDGKRGANRHVWAPQPHVLPPHPLGEASVDIVFVLLGSNFIKCCAVLYSHEPRDLAELKAAAEKILGKQPVVGELLDAARKAAGE